MNTASTVPLEFSTGLSGLDRALNGLLQGDNVVLQVDDIEDYARFVDPFVRDALQRRGQLDYFRFADHRPLVPAQPGVTIHEINPEAGFEPFVGPILDVIEARGRGALYVFDGLSELAADWYSDRMLGNFFMITCPFLFKLDTIAYFALFKKRHSIHATQSIHQTAQVVMDVYRNRDRLYIHPLKVDRRYSPTLYTLHAWEGDAFRPVTSSTTISAMLSGTPQPWLDFSIHRPGIWASAVSKAQKTLEGAAQGVSSADEVQESFQRLLRIAVTRDERFSRLAHRYLDLDDLMAVLQRMIGTGLIGGKSLGMLLSRAIVRKAAPAVYERMEAHDSFFIGSDVFYTYLVQNGCWDLRRRAADLDYLMGHTEEVRQRLLGGQFPDYIRQQFMEMLEYFGQLPIIVRSSSLLEDSYGNAFSGKYDTVFCANQGTPAQRLDAFMNAVRTVYASTLSPEALSYRASRGLLDQDEQMSLLVQRVSGALYGELFFPQIAGVGFSFNPFVWNEDIDPHAGFLRLVFGLGTRAVDRTADDHTRLIALNLPGCRPEAPRDVPKYAQRQVDVLDLPHNVLTTRDFSAIAAGHPDDLPLELFVTTAPGGDYTYLTFDRLLSDTPFADDLRTVLAVIQEAYDHPVDIEFTANFLPDGTYRFNLVQCRPFQVRIKGEGIDNRAPAAIPAADLMLETAGPVIGHSTSTAVDRVVYVVPEVYGRMTVTQRYEVARTVGKLNRLALDSTPRPIVMLLGPGRWATSTPALGVPVTFAEINATSVIGEVASMHQGLVPDVSLGTHFFNDLVETDMLYLAVFPERKGHALNADLLLGAHNRLVDLVPEAAALAEAVRVVEAADLPSGVSLRLYADAVGQKAVGYLTR